MLDDDIKEALLGSFREEAGDLLAELEVVMLEMEERPDDDDLIARAFRALHTIKGNGAMFGFEEIESFSHELEKIFDKLRNHEARTSKEIIDLTLAARDHLHGLLKGEGGDPASRLARQELLRSLQGLVATGGDEAAIEDGGAAGSAEAVYRIRFHPSSEILATGTDLLDTLRELRRMGQCRVMALVDAVPPLADMDPASFCIGWDIILITSKTEGDIRRVFAALGEDVALSIDVVEQADETLQMTGERMLGDILVERGDLSREDLDHVLRERRLLGEVLVDKNLTAPKQVEAALVEQQAVRDLRAKRDAEDRAATIRVHSSKLDRLVDLVGELVTVQARLSRLDSEESGSGLTAIAEEVERLTWELRDNAFSIRMVPIGTTFSRFRRLTRDLSREMGKEVSLVTEGAETELDKTVIEKINDPLVHLIRNCIGHGIETPAEREQAGKPGRGTIRLAASQSGADIVIDVSDDGRGLDTKALMEKAIARGLAERGVNLPEEEIYDFIFLPGLTTAREVDSVSGRGVGMDVVKSSIESLQGSVEVRSERGRGTSIRIRLPLTLAIIEGLEVAIGEDRFVMPLTYVEECVELHRKSESARSGRSLTNVRGELVPYIRLREWFGVPGERPDIEQTVIARTENNRVGLVVDHVVGEHQTVIKSLGKLYRGVNGFSGATILGDGKVALLLDVPRLVRCAEDEEASLSGGGERVTVSNERAWPP